MSHIHTRMHTCECKWLHTHTLYTVGVNQGFQAVIEQRQHFQASVKNYIHAERRSIWNLFNTLRWIIKAQGDLSCHVKLSKPCDHGVIMSCVLVSATCQPVVLNLTAAFYLCLRLSQSYRLSLVSSTKAPTKKSKRKQPNVLTQGSISFSTNYKNLIKY